jgi:site-specific recombinase XerD
VFCTASGRGVTQAYVRRLLPVLGARAGIEKRVHAHGLRHTHAAQLRQEGLDIGIISKQLGHRSIATTARYLDHICPLAVVEAMRGRSW